MAARVEIEPTDELGDETLAAVRGLLEEAFAGDFSQEDWEHALGGVHALAYDDDQLVGHGSVVPRELLLGERPMNAGYVEAVAVRADHRGQGYGRAIMEAVEGVLASDYEIGALAATGPGADFYGGRGWIRWRGRTAVLTPAGAVRTREDDGGVYVFPLSYTLNPKTPLTCPWRSGDPW